jgi:dual-specificity kinase
VKRYIKAAQVEGNIVEQIQAVDVNKESKSVHLYDQFYFHDKHQREYYCLVFETLGKSLYEIIKRNHYRGIHSLS